MRILELIPHHRHYWGVPHRRATDGCLIMTCYECGRERQVLALLRPADEPAGSAPSHERLAA
jgi:hypothetical protein